MYRDATLDAYNTPDVIHDTLRSRKDILTARYKALTDSLATWHKILRAESLIVSSALTMLFFWRKEATGVELSKIVDDKFKIVTERYIQWIKDYALTKDLPTNDATNMENLKILLKAGESLADEFGQLNSAMSVTKLDAIVFAISGPLGFIFKRISQVTWNLVRRPARAVAVAGVKTGEFAGDITKRAYEEAKKPLGQVLWIGRNIVPIAIAGGVLWLTWPFIMKAGAKKLAQRRRA